MGGDRETVMEAQIQLWRDWMGLWESTARRMLGGRSVAPVVAPAPGDRRFRDAEWQQNEIFDFIKQSYLLTANAMQGMVANLNGIPDKERKRVEFYTKQFADAFAPTNFPLTNPEVMRATLASNGENLVKGLDNLLADIERGQGELSIRQSADGFVIGENIATAPGKVVFRNELIELLQFDPTTEQVYERPLLIFPPWINKFYILDLRPENSFIRWLVDQGYTVFVVSWANPDRELAQMGFEDYMRDGIFAALDAVKDATGVERSQLRRLLHRRHAAGGDPGLYGGQEGSEHERAHPFRHLLGGADRFQRSRRSFGVRGRSPARSAGTADESSPAACSRLQDGGHLQHAARQRPDLVLRDQQLHAGQVAHAVRPALLESDTTRMPEKLHLSYLRQCYKDNALALGKMMLGGVTLDLSKVKVPVYLQSAQGRSHRPRQFGVQGDANYSAARCVSSSRARAISPA